MQPGKTHSLRGEAEEAERFLIAYIIVHYDTSGINRPLQHGVKLAPERSEGSKRRAMENDLCHVYRILFYSTCGINSPEQFNEKCTLITWKESEKASS